MTREEEEGSLAHLSGAEVRMVDVSGKPLTEREATARAHVAMSAEAVAAVRTESIKKGDVLGVAKVAGIMAAKKTSELIPLCHPLALSQVDVELDLTDAGVTISSSAKTVGPTGVEMEAMTAAAAAALTVYDMCKSVDRSIQIERIELTSKAGGRSGAWKRDP